MGRSNDSRSFEAGAAAAAEALAGGATGGRTDPKLLLVFASEAYDLDRLLAGIGSGAPGVPLIGCSTAGEIATDGPHDASVVVVGLGGSGLTAGTAAARGASSDLRQAGAEAAACARAIQDCRHRVLLLLTDGLAGDQQEIVRGAYGVVGAEVPLVGGCAGDDLMMKATHQFFGDQVLGDAVVAASLGSDAPLGVGVRHGWRKVGTPMLVTRSASNRIWELDGRPALDAYLERLGAPPEARAEPAAFTQFALTHPLGLSRRTGEPQVRFIGEADFEDRSLGCIAEVPQGGMAWIMEGDESSVLQATDAACHDALGSLGGRPPIALLAFDCIARRGILGDEGIRREVDRVARHAGGAPVAGFYTYGEIARTSGISGFHNQTLVVLALS